MLEIKIAGHQLILHPEKCLFWPLQRMLIISDFHAGKITHFRKSGIAVPQASFQKDIARIKKLLTDLKPLQCIFLGDLFHSKINSEWLQVQALFEEFTAVEFILVNGNHDTSLLKQPLHKLHSVNDLAVGDILLTHEPQKSSYFNFCGHLHPAVHLRQKARQSMSLPCFALSKEQLLFPAFGSFTGTFYINEKDFEKVYCLGANLVFEVTQV